VRDPSSASIRTERPLEDRRVAVSGESDPAQRARATQATWVWIGSHLAFLVIATVWRRPGVSTASVLSIWATNIILFGFASLLVRRVRRGGSPLPLFVLLVVYGCLGSAAIVMLVSRAALPGVPGPVVVAAAALAGAYAVAAVRIGRLTAARDRVSSLT
jgi:hypothetical protein